MRFGYAPTQIQAQPESAGVATARGVGAIKWLCGPLNLYSRHTASMIGNLYRYSMGVTFDSNQNLIVFRG